ncbi:protein serine/threonine phosphatase [Catenulispora acidiphila DSM 44928]|uniref:Protein serine/threonine phosphatase n=1 Tax=Catenulispora acidiphila (strain DSM 44928 / JCM 14897 / NBRC 102108 / NRRL B-24433 / ID139908) TaxID=479433 RepID=C7PY10_CATAD|nr:PP2C family protein-serine/threonine phosphatase [Catenulispora acidiphila]ACU73470.1 protein serine/threonine phosphatase [Catenulispora acidiphila DSM 44928]
MVWLRRPDPRRDIAVSAAVVPGDPEAGGTPVTVTPAHSTWTQRLVPYLFIAVIVGADLATPKEVTFSSTLSVAPALSALLTRSVFQTICTSITAIGVSAVLYTYSLHVAGEVEVAACGAILVVTVVSAVSLGLVGRQSRMLANVRSVAETAQHVVLREVPPELTQVRTAVAYRAAAAEARIGGDLYEALSTRFGDRLLIGDVRGKGLPAVEAAADVLGVFREAAYTEADLSRVADRMHAMLARRPAGTEEFVTAVLLSVHPERPTVEVVNCGHPPPLLMRDGHVAALAPAEPGPPLGLFDLATPSGSASAPASARFAPGDTLLLYTDGTTEARDHTGRFFDLPAFLTGRPATSPAELTRQILTGLAAHAGARLDDDVALLVVRRKPYVPGPAAEV